MEDLSRRPGDPQRSSNREIALAVIESPYKPPNESAASSLPSESQSVRADSLVFKTTQVVCYGWLVILFLMWQQDGLNFLIQRDIGRLISIVTGCATIALSAIFVRQRFRAHIGRCVAYVVFAGLLQLGVVNTIVNHSVERFPM
jgi:hypothetical protein